MSRSTVVLLVAIVGLLVAYPLSVVPAGFLFQVSDGLADHSAIWDRLDVFYYPLLLLPEPMEEWIDRLWGYGRNSGAIMRGVLPLESERMSLCPDRLG